MELHKILSDHLSRNDLYYFSSDDHRIFITRDHPLVTVLPDYTGINEAASRSDDSLASSRDLTDAERLYIEGRRKSEMKTIYIGNSADHINGQGAVINGNIKDAETGEVTGRSNHLCAGIIQGIYYRYQWVFHHINPPGFLYIPL